MKLGQDTIPNSRFSPSIRYESAGLQLLQVRKIQQGPQTALHGGMNQLLQIRQMSLKLLTGYADGDVGSELGSGTATIHCSPLDGKRFCPAYLYLMLEKTFLAQRVVKEL